MYGTDLSFNITTWSLFTQWSTDMSLKVSFTNLLFNFMCLFENSFSEIHFFFLYRIKLCLLERTRVWNLLKLKFQQRKNWVNIQNEFYDCRNWIFVPTWLMGNLWKKTFQINCVNTNRNEILNLLSISIIY